LFFLRLIKLVLAHNVSQLVLRHHVVELVYAQ
jgi:hypothetical protein